MRIRASAYRRKIDWEQRSNLRILIDRLALFLTGAQSNDPRSYPQHGEMVRPPLRHSDSLLPVRSALIGCAKSVLVLTYQRTFDRVWRPLARFIQQWAGHSDLNAINLGSRPIKSLAGLVFG